MKTLQNAEIRHSAAILTNAAKGLLASSSQAQASRTVDSSQLTELYQSLNNFMDASNTARAPDFNSTCDLVRTLCDDELGERGNGREEYKPHPLLDEEPRFGKIDNMDRIGSPT